MTLVQAFEMMAPVIGDEAVDAEREQASGVLLQALRIIARRFRVLDDRRDDAVQDVIVTLTRQGPRGRRQGAPDTDARVRGFLRTCLFRALDDIGWTRPTGDRDDELDGLAGPEADLDRDILAEYAHGLLDEARRTLYDDFVPYVAATYPARFRPGFLETIGDLQDLSAGRTSFDALVVRRLGASATSYANRLYKQQSRARQRVVEHVEPFAAERLLPAEKVLALLQVIEDDLRARADDTAAPAGL